MKTKKSISMTKTILVMALGTILLSACGSSKHNNPTPVETIADVQAKLVGHAWVTTHAVGTKSDNTTEIIPNGAVFMSDVQFMAGGNATESDYGKGLKWVLNSTTNLVVTLNGDTDPNDVINATITFSSDGHTLTLDYKGTFSIGPTTYKEIVQTLSY